MQIFFNVEFAMMKMMFSHFLWGICLISVYKLHYALGTECDKYKMNECLEKFHYFEERIFPNYGRSETELDETCREMNDTVLCPYGFDSCSEDADCDEECKTALQMTNAVKHRSNLPSLYEELCEETKLFRTEYLDHASCLHQASTLYEECYNTSSDSLVHIFNNQHLLNTEVKCCLYSWILRCYTEKTNETCGEEAAVFVSDALKILRHGVEEECRPYNKCDMPPLPGQDTGGNLEPTDSSSGSGVLLSTDASDGPAPTISGSSQLALFTQTSLMFAIICVGLLSLI